jgi:hypothetical protein
VTDLDYEAGELRVDRVASTFTLEENQRDIQKGKLTIVR